MLVRLVAPIGARTVHRIPRGEFVVDGAALDVSEEEARRLVADFPGSFEIVGAESAEKLGVVPARTLKRG